MESPFSLSGFELSESSLMSGSPFSQPFFSFISESNQVGSVFGIVFSEIFISGSVECSFSCFIISGPFSSEGGGSLVEQLSVSSVLGMVLRKVVVSHANQSSVVSGVESVPLLVDG